MHWSKTKLLFLGCSVQYTELNTGCHWLRVNEHGQSEWRYAEAIKDTSAFKDLVLNMNVSDLNHFYVNYTLKWYSGYIKRYY